MRDHFDPMAPLVYQQSDHHSLGDNRYNQNLDIQDQMQHQMLQEHYSSGTASPDNPFDAGLLSPELDNPYIRSPSPAPLVTSSKRTSNDILDCNVLQSSLKRVRLSRCPGEFRLQRDLKTLDSKHWGTSNAAANALNFSSTTWIHRGTGVRLTMVDALRIYLYLPMMAFQQGSTNGTWIPMDPKQQYLYQKQSYHRDYRWRIMIQIPRMYPHRPPEVTRIEGLSLDTIAINERPPESMHTQARMRDNPMMESCNSSFLRTPSNSLLQTEAQIARSSMTSRITNETSRMRGRKLSAIEWNQWSPISGLAELLDFLMAVASSNLSTKEPSETSKPSNGKSTLGSPMTARMASSSSSSLSSVSSSSSSRPAPHASGWGTADTSNQTGNIFPSPASFLTGNRSTTTSNSQTLTEETATTSSSSSTVSGASFLLPNRFDVGYGRSNNEGYDKCSQNANTFGGAAVTRATQPPVYTLRGQHEQRFRDVEDGDDVCMDMT